MCADRMHESGCIHATEHRDVYPWWFWFHIICHSPSPLSGSHLVSFYEEETKRHCPNKILYRRIYIYFRPCRPYASKSSSLRSLFRSVGNLTGAPAADRTVAGESDFAGGSDISMTLSRPRRRRSPRRIPILPREDTPPAPPPSFLFRRAHKIFPFPTRTSE